MILRILMTLDIEKLILATSKMDKNPAKTWQTTRTLFQLGVKGRLRCIRLVQAWYVNGLISKEQAAVLFLLSAVWGDLHLTATMVPTKTQ